MVQLVHDRFKSRVAVYLLLEQSNKILLSLRQGTGYADGFYSFVSGHVDEGESATHAMIREAKEEVGIDIVSHDLEFVHVLYGTEKTSGVTYVNFYFRCTNWQGNPLNCEPDKCGKVAFFAKEDLPGNLIPQCKQALEYIARGLFFSELGW